jgi:hypothetical protein
MNFPAWRDLFRGRARRLGLAVPEVTAKGGGKMANLQLDSDTIATLTILVYDASGAIVPAPSGDQFSVVSSNPASLGAAIGKDANGNPAVVLTPLVQASPGLSVTVSDSIGLAAFTEGVDIVEDTVPKALGLDLVHAATASQPVPSAPGP